MERSEIGMDDFWAFVEFRWSTEIIDKYGKKLDGIKTKDKVKLFNVMKVF